MVRRVRSFAAAVVLASGGMTTAFTAPFAAEPAPRPAWATTLERDLAAIDAEGKVRIGVWVRDLDSGADAQFRGEQRWYLASMVKVPVAIAVMRGVERGDWTLDTTVTLRASDYVDGAGPTKTQPVGAHLAVRWLLEQMIVQSDNTATDVLIDLVGVAEVNAVLASLVPEGFRPITTLSETRRLIYGRLVPGIDRLRGQDLLLLRSETSDAERVKLLSQLVGAPAGRGREKTLDAAYDAYYASGLNSAGLDAYANLLTLLAQGKALGAPATTTLLAVMERVETGTHRIKAGLPPFARFAHKTGTQRRRVCDAGIVRWPESGRERRAVVVACTREEPSLERAELALQQIGSAVCRSGLFTTGASTDAPSCPAVRTSAPASAPPGRTADAPRVPRAPTPR